MPSIAERKRIITDFLARCNDYAGERLDHYRVQLDQASAPEALAIQDKIGHWTAYRAFNLHAIAELDAGELDDWLDH